MLTDMAGVFNFFIMRVTQDWHEVCKTDLVWEIVFKYYNEETSLAEPERKESHEVPKKYRVWKYKDACEEECLKINLVIQKKFIFDRC